MKKGKTATATQGEEVTTLVVLDQQEQQPQNLSTEERLSQQRERFQTLDALLDKEFKLQESRSNLKKFIVGNDDSGNSVVLRDSKGREFKTGKSEVVAEVVELVSKTIDAMLAEVQQEILSV